MTRVQETLSNRIYKHIKDAIIKNEIKPKEKIPEKKIAGLFNSSTTPVREAILRLTAEGYLEMSSNRRAVVRETTIDEWFDIQEALLLLDTYACTQAIKTMTSEDMQILKNKTEEMAKYCKKNNINKYLELNYEIHEYIFRFLKNRYLHSLLDRVWEEYKKNFHKILISQYYTQIMHLNKFNKLHKELIKAFETKNISLLKRVLKNHWIIFP